MTGESNAPLRFLTMPEILRLLGVGRSTLTLWIQSGYFPQGQQINPAQSRLRWPEQQVTDWMQSRPVGRGRGSQQYQRNRLAVAERQAAGLPPRPTLKPKSERQRPA